LDIFHADQLPGRTVRLVNDKEYLYFSGTDYLGMGHNEPFRAFLNEGLDRYGTHFGSSRNNSLRLDIYHETETALARYAGAPASITVSSGMWAGQLVMKTIESVIAQTTEFQTTQYHYAPAVHPALRGNQFVSNKVPWKVWAKDVVNSVKSAPSDVVHIICTDSIGSPWAEEFDFSVFKEFFTNPNVWIIADDSHFLGVAGPNGQGNFVNLRAIFGDQTIVVSSLNKALGIPGGVIFANQEVIDIFCTSPWFAGASPAAPAYMFALKCILEEHIFQTALSSLRDNTDFFTQKIKDCNLFNSIAAYPVFCSKEKRLFDHLLESGIMASCFSYPAPTDPPVTRLAINALHQKKDLDQLAEVCMKF
jgi:8-amino-7-oxononanoate synthase